MEVKPTPEQLVGFYQKNRSYFDQLAKFYYENDREYYNEHISPLLISLQPGEVYCPYCQQKTFPYSLQKLTTAGIILVVLGVISGFFGFILHFGKFGVLLPHTDDNALLAILGMGGGFIAIMLGIAAREKISYCQNCKLKIV